MSAPRICRTPDEAFQAGLEAKCEHKVKRADCKQCELTDEEIRRLVVLLQPPAAAPTPQRRTAA